MSLFQHIKRYKLSVLCIVAIWTVCLVKPPSTGLDSITNIDKIVHTGLYFSLCTIIWWEYLHSHSELSWLKIVAFACIAPILMSVGIEFAQGYATTYRSMDWEDVVANSVGVLISLPSGYFVLRNIIWNKNDSRNSK